MAKNKKKNQKIIGFIIGGAVLFLLMLAGIYWWIDKQYQDKIYPHIYVGDQALGGKTYLEALEILDNAKKDFDNNGLSFQYQETTNIIPTTLIKDEPSGLSTDILTINSQETTNAAYAYAKDSFWQKIRILFCKKKISLTYNLDPAELTDVLSEKFSSFENPAQDAKLTFNADGSITISDETLGEAFNWEKVITQVNNNVENLNNQKIELVLEADYPELKKSATADMVKQTTQLLKQPTFTLTYNDESWVYDI